MQRLSEIENRILRPVAEGLAAEETPYKGVLYAGLMITEIGPKVIEFNVRFGDPEAQVILLRMDTDLAEVMMEVVEKRLHQIDLNWNHGASVCVIAAAPGYPGPPTKGIPISLAKSLKNNNSNISCSHIDQRRASCYKRRTCIWCDCSRI